MALNLPDYNSLDLLRYSDFRYYVLPILRNENKVK